ncbi:hypothetical protein [Nostoc sp.]
MVLKFLTLLLKLYTSQLGQSGKTRKIHTLDDCLLDIISGSEQESEEPLD